MRKILILIILSMVLVSPAMAQSSDGPSTIGQDGNYLTYDSETRQTLDVYRGETYVIENDADEPIHLTADTTMPAGTDIYTNGTNVTKPIQPGESLEWEVPIDEQKDVIYYSSADRDGGQSEGGVIRIFDVPGGDGGGFELPFGLEIETVVALVLIPISLGVGWLIRDRGVGIEWVN